MIATMTTLAPTFGSSNCSENLRRLSCAFACDPSNGRFVAPTLSSLTGSFNPVYVNGLYQSCKGRCASPPYTFEQVYGTNFTGKTALVALLSSH